jgi:hypothetical protein
MQLKFGNKLETSTKPKLNFGIDKATPDQKQKLLEQVSGQSSMMNQQKPHVKVVFCIPGREFTANFLQSWTKLCNALYMNQIPFILSNCYSPVVYYARSACLKAHVLKGRNQKPFQGEITYDYLMWIDSDIVWEPEHFFALLQRMEQNKNIDVLGGTYLMADGYHTTIVDEWCEEYFSEHGSFKFLTMPEVKDKLKDPEVQKNGGIFECVYAGFGWLMIRQGIFEQIEYPFFKPQWHELKNGSIRDFSSEDSTFFLEMREKGIKCYIDPNVNVGHEKMICISYNPEIHDRKPE